VQVAGADVVATLGEDAGGLGEALRRIAAGDASALVLARLRDGARSLRELLALIEWLAAAEAELIVLDVGLDTASQASAGTLALLTELERCEREPAPGRAPRGRPGLASREPELAARILGMRERGMTLQAIADALNAEGVPTRRGGARWRPSSVQASAGYRRPRPPHPVAPPHPAGPRPPRPPGPGVPRGGASRHAQGPRGHEDPRP
jgi:DNA invertase Pin-like site-specific DNA recombinase